MPGSKFYRMHSADSQIKTLYPRLSTDSTQEASQNDIKFVYWDVKHLLEQKLTDVCCN